MIIFIFLYYINKSTFSTLSYIAIIYTKIKLFFIFKYINVIILSIYRIILVVLFKNLKKKEWLEIIDK